VGLFLGGDEWVLWSDHARLDERRDRGKVRCRGHVRRRRLLASHGSGKESSRCLNLDERSLSAAAPTTKPGNESINGSNADEEGQKNDGYEDDGRGEMTSTSGGIQIIVGGRRARLRSH